MKINSILFILSVLFFSTNLYSQDIKIDYNTNESTITLGNVLFERVLKIDSENNAFYTSSFKDKRNDYEYYRKGSDEFIFHLDGNKVTGNKEDKQFVFLGHIVEDGKDNSKILKVHLKGVSNTPAHEIELFIYYQVYEDLALVRKWMEIVNTGKDEKVLNNLAWEKIRLDPWGGPSAQIYANYGRYKFKAPYVGGKDDPAILVKGKKGTFILGNEAPGVMKYIGIYDNSNGISIGLNPSDHDYPFKKHLKPNEVFTTPQSFVIFSIEEKPEDCLESDLAKYIRKYLGVKLFQREKRPLFCYNTWSPFTTNINELMVKEIADSLVGTGVEYLVMDDGWQDNWGDWNADKEKFPNGLKPVCDYIRSKGMKPGLWISYAAAKVESDAFKKYKEYAVKDKNGNPVDLHVSSNNQFTMNTLSPWYDYIKERIFTIVEENGIEYLKVDFAMVKSAYVMDVERSGSYDSTAQYKGREEFLYLSYLKLMGFFDELSEKFPELVIDCTFELWGDWHIIDYALIKHADVDWISNFSAKPPKGSREIRQLSWHHGLVVPSSCMVIGNQHMDAKNHEFSFLSNLSHTPTMLGDPRNLSVEEKEWYMKYYSWYKKMDEEFEVSKYFQTSDVFAEAKASNWDGFARFNTEKQGGILCFFRNDTPEDKRTFLIPWVNPDKEYVVKDIEGKLIGKYRGKVLSNDGLQVTIKSRNNGKVVSITLESLL